MTLPSSAPARGASDVSAHFFRCLLVAEVMDAYLVREAERHRGRLSTFYRRVAAHATTAAAVEILEC